MNSPTLDHEASDAEVVVMNSPTLTLAATVTREYNLAHQAAQSALNHAMSCGDALIQAKAAVDHGQWS